jgi:hypothetical protein
MAYYSNNAYTSFATDQEALAWAYASNQSTSHSHSFSTNPTTNYSSQTGGSYAGPIQIVLEPAEASNESGEGSGQDDSSESGRKR